LLKKALGSEKKPVFGTKRSGEGENLSGKTFENRRDFGIALKNDHSRVVGGKMEGIVVDDSQNKGKTGELIEGIVGNRLKNRLKIGGRGIIKLIDFLNYLVAEITGVLTVIDLEVNNAKKMAMTGTKSGVVGLVFPVLRPRSLRGLA